MGAKARPGTWSAAQRWAYAIGAPYHAQHRYSVHRLPAGRPSEVGERKLGLARDWDISGPTDLVQAMNRLGVAGHRHDHRMQVCWYCLMRRPTVASRREQLRDAGREDSDALRELWRLNAVQADWKGVRGSRFLAFDAARAVMLARDGLTFGWLEEEAAWNYMLDVARDVQRTYSSWREFGQDFLISRGYWQGTGQADVFGLEPVIHKLLRWPGVWRRLPWRVSDLEIPREVRAAKDGAPVWWLER